MFMYLLPVFFLLQGGMFVTVFDSTTGSYYSYSLQREIKDSTHDEAMDEDMSGSEFYSLNNLPFPVLFANNMVTNFGLFLHFG